MLSVWNKKIAIKEIPLIESNWGKYNLLFETLDNSLFNWIYNLLVGHDIESKLLNVTECMTKAGLIPMNILRPTEIAEI